MLVWGALLLVGAALHADVPTCPEGRRPFHLTLRHREGGSVGYNKGYTSMDLRFHPHAQEWWVMPFVDLRSHLFDDRKWAGNAGVGARFAPRTWCSLFGGNLYYDVRKSPHGVFHRAGIGMEYLARDWEVRTNGYIPFIHTRSGSFAKGLRERAFYGWDSEAGGWYVRDRLRLFGGGGPYLFATGCQKNAYGGRMRLTALYRDLFQVELEGTWDTVYHARGQAEIGINIPFGNPSKTKMRGCSSCAHAHDFNARLYDVPQRLEILALRQCR